MDIRALTDEETAALHDGISLAARYLDSEPPLSIDQVQTLYDAIRKDHPENVEAQIALGLAFGETIVSKAGFEWVRVKDEWGEETALSLPGLSVACHPISMLQKRIAKGEQVDIAELRDGVIETIEKHQKNGGYDTR